MACCSKELRDNTASGTADFSEYAALCVFSAAVPHLYSLGEVTQIGFEKRFAFCSNPACRTEGARTPRLPSCAVMAE